MNKQQANETMQLSSESLSYDRALEMLNFLAKDGVIEVFIRSCPEKKKSDTGLYRYFAYFVDKRDDFQGSLLCSDPLFVIDKFLCKIAGYERNEKGVITPKFQNFNILLDVHKKTGIRFIVTHLPSFE